MWKTESDVYKFEIFCKEDTKLYNMKTNKIKCINPEVDNPSINLFFLRRWK